MPARAWGSPSTVDALLLAPDLLSGDGGIARILRLHLKALCELAADGQVRVVSLNDAAPDPGRLRPYSGPSLVGFRACGRSKATFVWAALRAGLRSDVIVCGHVAQLPVAWAVSLLRPGMRYFLVAHGIEVWRRFTLLERRALKGARCIWCVSEFTRNRLLEFCPLPEERTAVLPNALDPALEPSSPAHAPGDGPRVLTISRLSLADSYKGIGHLIEAMPAVRAEIAAARLRIVGQGDAESSLRELAGRLVPAGAVEFAGYRTDPQLADEFERCALFALPSQKEGFGIVYVESMAHGRPCLGANSGGTPEVISPDTGVLVEYGDVPGISRAIVGALRRQWSLQAIVERARVFSYSSFKERLASLLTA